MSALNSNSIAAIENNFAIIDSALSNWEKTDVPTKQSMTTLFGDVEKLVTQLSSEASSGSIEDKIRVATLSSLYEAKKQEFFAAISSDADKQGWSTTKKVVVGGGLTAIAVGGLYAAYQTFGAPAPAAHRDEQA